MPRPLYPRANRPRYVLNGKYGGSHSRYGHSGEDKNLCSLAGIKPRFLGHAIYSSKATEKYPRFGRYCSLGLPIKSYLWALAPPKSSYHSKTFRGYGVNIHEICNFTASLNVQR
jgi:hypothetical protein